MRRPLTRQNSTRDKHRYSAYQNRIFFYLVTLVTAPLLLLGVLSSVVYYRQTVTRSDALLASVRENVETQMEIALSNLRAYYSAVVSTDNYQTLCQKTVPPYSEYTLVRDMQTAMRGGNLVDKYVEGYTYINLRNGWILSNDGMYRLADAANRDEVAHLLSEWAEQHAAMMWVNRTDQPTPALADTPLNTVDLTGELLVLRSSSYRTGSYAVLIVPVFLLLRRYFVRAAYEAMTCSKAALGLFGSLPVAFYFFDYATTIYSDALYAGIHAVNESLPALL